MERSLLYIEELESPQHKALMLEAHDLICALIPNLRSVFKWNTPFFDYYGKYFCYLNISGKIIYLSFCNCMELKIPSHLKQEKLKSTYKVYLPDLETIRSEAITQIILEAALIHESKNKK